MQQKRLHNSLTGCICVSSF